MISTGCASLDRVRDEEAARDRGKAEAVVTLPAWPEDCRRKEAHAALVEGTEVRSVLKRERAALDRQNARADRCAGYYDDLKERVRG